MPGAASGRGLRGRTLILIITLTIVSVITFVAISAMLIRLQISEARTADQVRENAVWAAYQADREAGHLVEVIMRAELNPSAQAYDEVMRRFDVLYSRADVIGEAEFSFDVVKGAVLGDASNAVRSAIKDLTPIFDHLAAHPDLRGAAMPVLLERTQVIRGLTESFVQKANAANNSFRVEERSFVRGTYATLAVSVLMLTFALLAVVGLLIAQIVHISRTGRQLEVLSERNAKAAEAAEAGTRAKSAFLASMSHEIRTPLNGIIGMAEILAETPLSETQRQQLGVIWQSGELLLDVINDVLDFSKVESGKIDICEAEFNLRELLDTVEAVMSPRAVAKGLRLSIEAPAIAITADPARLRQILVNLVGNAIKFTEQGSITVTARLEGDANLAVKVSDTGIGILEGLQSKLFKEFSQLDNSNTRRFGGTGLGLVICKRLIEAMGGTIGADSRPGEGSQFWFLLPVKNVKSAIEPAPIVETPSIFQGSILVAEDNPINQQVVSRLLERMGLSVQCVANGAEALESVSNHDFDLILMDMQMPVLDGLATTRTLRERGKGIPIVGLTANAFVSDRDACFSAGMNGFLSKPVTKSKLAAALAPWLKARSFSSETEQSSRSRMCEPDTHGIDEDYRTALIAELGDEVVERLVGELLTDGLAQLRAARRAFLESQDETCMRCLHSLKGAVQSLGFAAIGATIEAGRDVRLLDAAWFDRLETMIRAVRKEE